MSTNYKKIIRTIQEDFIRYRNLVIVEPLEDDKVSSTLQRLGYLQVKAELSKPRGSRKTVIILVLDDTQKYSHNSPELKKLLEEKSSDKNELLSEIILVVEKAFKNKKNMMDTIKAYQSKEEKGPDPTGQTMFYNAIEYAHMLTCVPEHIIQPKFIRIMSESEKNEILDFNLKELKDFPKMLRSDPVGVWIGARNNQMIELTRVSESSGTTISYRVMKF